MRGATETSRNIAAVLGPALVAVTITEYLNYCIFAGSPQSAVYLNGTILFVAGLATIRAHNRWSWRWPVVVTLTGWLLAGLGLVRMFAPSAQTLAPGTAKMGAIALVLAIGCFLMLKAFGPRDHHTQP